MFSYKEKNCSSSSNPLNSDLFLVRSYARDGAFSGEDEGDERKEEDQARAEQG